jgi:hypothetical protein
MKNCKGTRISNSDNHALERALSSLNSRICSFRIKDTRQDGLVNCLRAYEDDEIELFGGDCLTRVKQRSEIARPSFGIMSFVLENN